jgi:hypothetical protein
MRKKIPTSVVGELQDYFCDTRVTCGSVACVVTGNTDYAWHHLNHRKSDNHLSNIVPLIQNLNKNLDIAKDHVKYLDPRLECNHLEGIGQTAFWLDGQVARAFGCARIGYYIAQYKRYPFSEQLKWAGQALYYARHKPNYQMIEQLLVDTIIKPLTQNNGPVQKEVIRSLLQEFETLLTLGGDTKAAVSLSEYSRSALPPMTLSNMLGQSEEEHIRHGALHDARLGGAAHFSSVCGFRRSAVAQSLHLRAQRPRDQRRCRWTYVLLVVSGGNRNSL